MYYIRLLNLRENCLYLVVTWIKYRYFGQRIRLLSNNKAIKNWLFTLKTLTLAFLEKSKVYTNNLPKKKTIIASISKQKTEKEKLPLE